MVTVLAAVATALFAAALLSGAQGRSGRRMSAWTAAMRTRTPSRPGMRPGSRPADAGMPLSAAQFQVLRLAAAAVALALVASLTGSTAVAMPPALAAAWLPQALVARRAARRSRELAAAWPDGLRDLAASVSAGMSLPQAVVSLAQGGPPPLRVLLSRVPALLPAFGLTGALEQARAQAADPATDRVIEVLLLAHERGGRILPELLADLAEDTARDLHLQERMATAQLELRINARAVFVLPWLVLCALTMRPGPYRAFYASPRGVPVVLAGAALSLVGIAIVGRLGRPPIEPRVLTGAPGGGA